MALGVGPHRGALDGLAAPWGLGWVGPHRGALGDWAVPWGLGWLGRTVGPWMDWAVGLGWVGVRIIPHIYLPVGKQLHSIDVEMIYRQGLQ